MKDLQIDATLLRGVGTAWENSDGEMDIGVSTSERKDNPCSRSHPAARIIPKDFHNWSSVNLDKYEMHINKSARVLLLACLGLTYSSFILQVIRTPG